MKKNTLIFFIIGLIIFSILLYWHGEKGRYQMNNGLVFDTKTGNTFYHDQSGKLVPLEENKNDSKIIDQKNKYPTIYRMVVWPYLTWRVR